MKAVLAIVLGVLVGGLVNMGLIMISGQVIPLPDGVDPKDMESLKESMHLFEPRHFVFPFLAHALGTLVGAAIAALLAPRNKMRFAFGIGVFFLLGGTASAFMLPAPTWFVVTDLVGAYIPMAWIGGKITRG